MLVLERLIGTRVVSTQKAMDSALSDPDWPGDQETLRFAFDELLTLGPLDEKLINRRDPHAVVTEDASFFGIRLDPERGARLLEAHCEWPPPPPERWPAQAQGAVAGVPTKILFTEAHWLFVVQSPFLSDFEERVF